MDILKNLSVDKLFKTVEKRLPDIGTIYGILAPLAETSSAMGDTPLQAITRELMALTNPKIPTLEGIVGWWKGYCQKTAQYGIMAWLGGEVIGNKKLSDAGVNMLKGTAVAAVIGEVGQGGGAPYEGSQPRRNIGSSNLGSSPSWGYKS